MSATFRMDGVVAGCAAELAAPALDLIVRLCLAAHRHGGTVEFADSGQSLGSSRSHAVALGDVDGDGDLDTFVANVSQGNTVWQNDGSGIFSDSGQSLGSANSQSVVLGDVNGDGDLDAFVANVSRASTVWQNDGSGTYTDSGQGLGSASSHGVTLGDVDSDGDLDAFVANYGRANKVWQNDGNGVFTDNGQNLGAANSSSVTLGDMDGDSDLGVFVANQAGQSNKVWLSEGGSAGFTVTGTAPAAFVNNSEHSIFEVAFAHNGISGDRNLEMSFWNVYLLRTDCATALTDVEANAIMANLRLRLDDGDGIFEIDGSDLLVADVDDLDLTAGVMQISFTNDDVNVQVAPATAKSYWLSVLTTGRKR